MNIVLLTVGKTEESYWKEALAEYQRRLQHYVPFELQALPEVKNTKNLTMSQQKNNLQRRAYLLRTQFSLFCLEIQ